MAAAREHEPSSKQTEQKPRFSDWHSSGKPHSSPSKLWQKLVAEERTLKTMFKGAAAPAIALSIYQSTAIAERFTTVGYLLAIMSILGMSILPRAKFIQTMLFNVIGVCIGAAVGLLVMYSSTQARKHSTPHIQASERGPSPGSQVTAYNSSASAVSAIWLFFNIWLANAARASRPQFQIPVIIYSILANVTATFAPTMPTMTSGIALVERLLEAFLLGFGIATAVSFVIFPFSCRAVFFKQTVGLTGLIKAALGAQKTFLQSMEREDIFMEPATTRKLAEDIENSNSRQRHHFEHNKKKEPISDPYITPEVKNLHSVIASMGELYGKLHADITFAKRESAIGYLDAEDIDTLHERLRSVLLPIMGMVSVADIFQRIARREAWGKTSKEMHAHEDSDAASRPSETLGNKMAWNKVMKSIHEPFEVMTGAMIQGLDHTLISLDLVKRPKSSVAAAQSDVEANVDNIVPGHPDFSQKLLQKVQHFYDSRRTALTEFCNSNGIVVDGITNDRVVDHSAFLNSQQSTNQQQSTSSELCDHKQFYLLLEMEYLLWSTGKAVHELVRFADVKVQSGAMKRRHFIVPGLRRLRKWIINSVRSEDGGVDHTPDSAERSGGTTIYSGSAFETRRDPEHLPPTSTWQKISTYLCKFGSFFGSSESAFGFRVACATMTVGILAYLEKTQSFFQEQRLVWAMIMIAIGMTVTAGSGIFGFLARIFGTFVALCTSLIMWYIVDGHRAGVIVFLFVFSFFEVAIFVKYPRFIAVAIITLVTQVLIIGYELQVDKIGIKLATSNHQTYYPIYLLAPYRLATVTAGLAIAFIWTFIPYPIFARSQLRHDLGKALYLLANYYSVVHTTVSTRVRGLEGDVDDRKSPGRRLKKARTKVFAKEMALLGGLRTHSSFTKWEPGLGGRFPKQTYDIIIDEVQHILNYLALLSYASASFSHDPLHDASEDEANLKWIQDFARLVGSLQLTSHEITSTLALLSNSVTNGTPLPPYLAAPESYQLSARLQALDPTILSARHILERGYSAFAVMQIASSLVSDDLGRLIDNVKELVGEIDFSFHVISTADGKDSEETLLGKENDSVQMGSGTHSNGRDLYKGKLE